MNELLIWVITGFMVLLLVIVARLLYIAWYAFTSWRDSLEAKLSELIEGIQRLVNDNTSTKSELRNLTKRVDTHEGRINNHSNRVRSIEINIAKHGES